MKIKTKDGYIFESVEVELIETPSMSHYNFQKILNCLTKLECFFCDPEAYSTEIDVEYMTISDIMRLVALVYTKNCKNFFHMKYDFTVTVAEIFLKRNNISMSEIMVSFNDHVMNISNDLKFEIPMRDIRWCTGSSSVMAHLAIADKSGRVFRMRQFPN